MPSDKPNFADRNGFVLCRSVLARSEIAALASRIDTRYQLLEEARRQGGLAALNELVPAGQRFTATASSLTLGAILSDAEFKTLLAMTSIGPAGEWTRSELQSPIACDIDQAWVRRQYAPEHYPASHAPHGWHQDGALRFDFLSHGNGSIPPDAVLPMVTCWIALGPCGAEAPGFELVPRRLDNLLAPKELADERVHTRFAPEEFSRPVLEPGDALLFRGDILHRTHVTPAMTKDRTSLEFRFFPADNLPPRLKGDQFIRLE